jgi:hypothetical protein
MLLEHPGRVINREDLRCALWAADTFVDFEHGLNAAMKRVRDSLGDSAETPVYIETVPRRGYRFLMPISDSGRRLESQPSQSELLEPTTLLANQPEAIFKNQPDAGRSHEFGALSRVQRYSKYLWASGLVLTALLVTLVAFNVVGRNWLLSRTAPPIRSIAVLPLDNLSGDPGQEYFADGITDALITELGRVSALRVISRQSVMRYKGSKKPLPEIARELGVDALVEGSAIRGSRRANRSLKTPSKARPQPWQPIMLRRRL